MRGHLVGALGAGWLLATAAVGCSRLGTSAYAEPPAPQREPLPADIPGCTQALERAQARLHAATTTEQRREGQRQLQDAQNRLIELQAAQRREEATRALARVRNHAPALDRHVAAEETATGQLEHADAHQLVLRAQGGQLQLDTDGLTDVRLDGQPIKLQELPQGSEVRASFAPGSTPPLARRIDARRTR